MNFAFCNSRHFHLSYTLICFFLISPSYVHSNLDSNLVKNKFAIESPERSYEILLKDELGIEKTKNWQIKGCLSALESSNLSVKAKAIDALYDLNALKGNVGIELIDSLFKSNNIEVKISAIKALGVITPNYKKYIPILLSELNNSNYNYRTHIINAIIQYDSMEILSFSESIEKLFYIDDHNSIGAACEIFSKHPEAINIPKHIERILALLVKSDFSISYDVRKLIISLGDRAKNYFPNIINLMDVAKDDAKLSIILTLIDLKAIKAENTDLVKKLLNSSDPRIFTKMLELIELDGCKAKSFLSMLEKFYQINHFGYSRFINDAIRAIASCVSIEGDGLEKILISDNYEEIVNALNYLEKNQSEINHYVGELIGIIEKNSSPLKHKAAFLLFQNAIKIEGLCKLISQHLIRSNSKTKKELLFVLHEIPNKCEEILPTLISSLTDKSDMVSYYSALCLNSYDQIPKDQIYQIKRLLRSPDSDNRHAACEAINQMKVVLIKDNFYSTLVDLLDDPENRIRASALTALSKFENHERSVLQKIGGMLDEQNPYVSSIAVKIISKNEIVFFSFKSTILKILLATNGRDRTRILKAIQNYKIKDRDIILSLVSYLNEIKSLKRYSTQMGDPYPLAFKALNILGPYDLEIILNILELSFENRLFVNDYYFLSYYFSGGNSHINDLINTLIDGTFELQIEAQEKEVFFTYMINALRKAQVLPSIKALLEKKIVEYSQIINWDSENITILENARKIFKNSNSIYTELLANRIRNFNVKKNVKYPFVILICHLTFWCALIFLYKRSKIVQTFFFWNKWSRRLFGLFYVEMLIKWVPFLRKILFSPFIENMKSDLSYINSGNSPFYENIRTKRDDKKYNDIWSLRDDFTGKILIESESGKGKTSIFAFLIQNSNNLSVYLPAWRCVDGVLIAIQEKILGPINQDSFLRDLIYSGTIDIYIDGVNEVTPDICEKIRKFAESNFAGNIFIATQPFNWIKPSGFKRIHITSMSKIQIIEYLNIKGGVYYGKNSIEIDSYKKQCEDYIGNIFSNNYEDEFIDIISNPMELDTIAFLIANKISPDPFNLYEQQFKLVEKAYRTNNFGKSFPLEEFADYIYDLKNSNQHVLDKNEYSLEFKFLYKHRIIVPYPKASLNDDKNESWVFRHDKLKDFFVAISFILSSNNKIETHINQTSFSGVYLFLAYKLPYNEAFKLREKIIQNAVDSKNHHMSDLIVKALRIRK
jgi:hypothetical protein